MEKPQNPTEHRMTRRSKENNYFLPGMYHVTIKVADGMGHPFGSITGDASQPDGSPNAPRVVLSPIGNMVEHELLNSISTYYPMVEVQTYVVMPEHMHFILEVHAPIISRNGKPQHLGQVIAGFKKGCNRRYWELTGQASPDRSTWRGEPASTDTALQRGEPASTDTALQRGEPASTDRSAGTDGSAGSCPAVCPQGQKVPSRGATGRPVLFAEGYVDVIPLRAGQLATQRAYIKNNPRSRLLRSQHCDLLQVKRGGIDTALKVNALIGFLRREYAPRQLPAETEAFIKGHLLTTAQPGEPAGTMVTCDSYGDRQLLQRRLLPVVCHRRDKPLFEKQKALCLKAAREGAVLISARIAKGEQDIMDTAISAGMPVILVADNGIPNLYHPSAERTELCQDSRMLIVTPWQYHYRPAEQDISVAECKAMNCVAQALNRTKDDWWKSF